ncbi:hypothetical protein GSI_07662 [Ganoderma sinense ZZ0214-1]|uniref:Uncharacterized protein n=1 Tax=Ganoderma sinense ZZ0214-1 TaxID=1077348 RepID=A0A2G8S8K0_9APHY|nr:hypothetical protein GSI_07662 [Ganoderma sinense ZZ0214-1]
MDPTKLEGFLPRLSQTLEELELLYFQFCRGYTADGVPDPASPNFFRDHTQYPAVRSLTIYRFDGPPLLDRLQHLFPALDGTLHIMSDPSVGSPAHEAFRTANRRAQDGSPSHAWKKLDRVVCSAGMLHALALRCPIRHVMLQRRDEERPRYAADALRANPVQRLKLTLACGRGMFDGIFTPELAGTLTHLTLVLVHDNFDERAERDAADAAQPLWDFLLGATRSALQPLHNVTHLRVVIHCKLHRGRNPWQRREEPADAPAAAREPDRDYPYSEAFMAAIRGGPAFDCDFATSLARALPSARYVFLMTGGNVVVRDPDQPARAGAWRSSERWNVSRGWRVANAGPATGGSTHPNVGPVFSAHPSETATVPAPGRGLANDAGAENDSDYLRTPDTFPRPENLKALSSGQSELQVWRPMPSANDERSFEFFRNMRPTKRTSA